MSYKNPTEGRDGKSILYVDIFDRGHKHQFYSYMDLHGSIRKSLFKLLSFDFFEASFTIGSKFKLMKYHASILIFRLKG
jgi:hypothetical protein